MRGGFKHLRVAGGFRLSAGGAMLLALFFAGATLVERVI